MNVSTQVSRNAIFRSVDEPLSLSGSYFENITVLWPEYLDWLLAGVER